MPVEEFVISGIRAEDEFIIASFSVANTAQRMQNLISIAEAKWAKQNGKDIPMPEQYKMQLLAGGIPPMIMRLPLTKWDAKGFQLSDTVLINVLETIDDIELKDKEKFGV